LLSMDRISNAFRRFVREKTGIHFSRIMLVSRQQRARRLHAFRRASAGTIPSLELEILSISCHRDCW